MQIRFPIKLEGMFKDEEGILSFMHGDLHNNQIIYIITNAFTTSSFFGVKYQSSSWWSS